MYNTGTGSLRGLARQQAAAAALAAAAGGRGVGNASAAAAAGRSAASAVLPPGPCDVGALQRSLLIVHGPSAFDMNR